MKLLKDQNGVIHFCNENDTPKICPFKAPLTQQVKPTNDILTATQNKAPQLMQVPQTCNSTCPLFVLTSKKTKHISDDLAEILTRLHKVELCLKCSHGAIFYLDPIE